MPSAAPLDTLENVLNTARVRLNDAIQQLSGDILTDNAVFTLTDITAAWRRLQQMLANYGVSIFNREASFPSVPACTSTDYGVFVFIDWDEYFDGNNPQSAPVLPGDMISPLNLWERISGSTGAYTPIDQVYNGLPTVPKDTLNRRWEWRDNAIYLNGATGLTDIRLRYSGFLPDFVENTTTAFSAQQVPIVNCLSPFAWLVCFEVAKSRGDMDAGGFDQLAISEAKLIYDRDVQQGKSLYKKSELGKMVDFDTPLQGPAGPRGPQGKG